MTFIHNLHSSPVRYPFLDGIDKICKIDKHGTAQVLSFSAQYQIAASANSAGNLVNLVNPVYFFDKIYKIDNHGTDQMLSFSAQCQIAASANTAENLVNLLNLVNPVYFLTRFTRLTRLTNMKPPNCFRFQSSIQSLLR